MTTDRQACGLSSFLPMSCRGRAEAFARRLQSRLQSLGRQPSGPNGANESEESWLTTSQHFPTNHQPAARGSSSSESDVYFDFDVYFGSPGSPLEAATEDIHVNRPVRGCATAVAASPGSDDSNYFDPEVFDFAKSPLDPPCNGHDADLGTYYDCNPLEDVCASAPDESVDTCCAAAREPVTPVHETPKTRCHDVTDNASPAHGSVRLRKPRVDYTKCNGVTRHAHSTEPREAKDGHSTEPHEAKTEACEAENTHSTETHELGTETNEDEVVHSTETHELGTETNEDEVVHSTETHELGTETNEDDVVHCTETHELGTETNEDEVVHSTETQELDRPTETNEDEVLGVHSTETHELGTETNEAEVGKLDATSAVQYTSAVVVPDGENVYCSTLSVSTHELLVECPSLEVTAAPESSAPKEAASRAEGNKLEVDDTDYEDRPQRVRRCSSLKTGKTPPGTPGRKKIVRFADVLGLDLADVRTFLDEVPKVPTSAYEDLQDADLSSSLSALAATMPKPDKTLVPMFVQPGGCADFFDRVREQQVCLENAVVSDVMLSTISGTVRVRNLDFNKSVHIRYSADGWKTFSDLQASYIQNSCDGFSDIFTFVLYAHTLTVGQRLEFAVRFQCHGCQYWDSNRGGNYVFQCLPPAGQISFRSHHMSTCPDEQWASFY